MKAKALVGSNHSSNAGLGAITSAPLSVANTLVNTTASKDKIDGERQKLALGPTTPVQQFSTLNVHAQPLSNSRPTQKADKFVREPHLKRVRNASNSIDNQSASHNHHRRGAKRGSANVNNNSALHETTSNTNSTLAASGTAGQAAT